VVTRAILTGTRLTVLPRFDAERVEKMGRRRAATHVSLVSTDFDASILPPSPRCCSVDRLPRQASRPMS